MIRRRRIGTRGKPQGLRPASAPLAVPCGIHYVAAEGLWQARCEAPECGWKSELRPREHAQKARSQHVRQAHGAPRTTS
jgi:hypothetical protein